MEEGRENASRRPMMLGWRMRRRMQISRSARLAWSGLLSTSATRLIATCAHPGGWERHKHLTLAHY